MRRRGPLSLPLGLGIVCHTFPGLTGRRGPHATLRCYVALDFPMVESRRGREFWHSIPSQALVASQPIVVPFPSDIVPLVDTANSLERGAIWLGENVVSAILETPWVSSLGHGIYLA